MSATGETIGVVRSKPASVLGWEEQLYALAIMLVSIMHAPLLQEKLLPLPGFNIPNLVAGGAFLAFLEHPGKLTPTDRLGRIAFFAFLAYAAFFLVDFIRSFSYLEIFHARFPKFIPAGKRDYFQSYFVVPLLLSCSFLYVLRRMCSIEGLTQVLRAISMGAFVLSVVTLGALALNPSVLLDPDPERVAIIKLMNDTLGIHYNTVSGMLAAVAPILLYMSLKRGGFWTVNYFVALTAVLLVKSRTGLLTFGGISFVTMIVLGRARELAAATPIIALAVLALLGPMLFRLLSIGFTQKSGLSPDILLSGREQSIWVPLLIEWFQDSERLFFGKGYGGIMTSYLLYSGLYFPAGEAHNVYLEFFLDNGIVLFGVFVAGIVAWIVWTTRLGRRLNNGLFWVLYLCVIAFLITGFTSRHYFPNADNGIMFPIVAAMINVARLKLAPGQQKGPQDSGKRSNR